MLLDKVGSKKNDYRKTTKDTRNHGDAPFRTAKTLMRFGPLQEHYLDFQGNNMLIFQSFRLGDSYRVNIEVSIEVCSDSVHCFRNFMSSTQAKFIQFIV